MSKKQVALLLILLASVFGVILWWIRPMRKSVYEGKPLNNWLKEMWLVRPAREPVYEGKPLSGWLKEMEYWNGDTNDAACVAFRNMGTNAIPALLSILQFPYEKPWLQTTAASWALYAMGTNALPALPTLTNLLFHSNALIRSAIALAGIGSEGVPVLLTALTNQNDRIRGSAASSLGWEHSDFNVIVPALIASLQDSDSIVHQEAVISLGQLHARPELAVPALMNDFSNNDGLLRGLILYSLGQYGARAKESVPMVVAALKDNDTNVRKTANLVLKRIDPETAAKLNAN